MREKRVVAQMSVAGKTKDLIESGWLGEGDEHRRRAVVDA
jgi:hypothetical protein